MRWIAAAASFSALAALAWALKWLIENYQQFGLGFCCGVIVAALLYWLVEYLGLNRRITD